MDQHVKKAIRFIKDRAGEYRIDPDRLGLTGASAGGHLATLAALTPLESDPSAKTPADRHSTAVRAVGVFFPPTDFLDWSGDGKRADLAVLGALLFVGGAAGRSDEEIVEKARAVSPVFRVGEPTIPFLFIHGDADRVVPLVHSERMVGAIKRGGGQAELLVKAGGGHPWLTLPEEVEVLARWFDKQLKGSGVAPTGPR